MKRLYLVSGIFIGFILTGCSATPKSQPIMKAENHSISSHITPKQCPMRNPIAIAFYNKGKTLHHPYKVIAKETISQFNKSGIKRQEAVVHDVLRQLAASVGGDAIINIKHDNEKISGEVIKFQA